MNFDGYIKKEYEVYENALLMIEMMIFIDECKDVDRLINEGVTDTAKEWYNKIKKLLNSKINPIVKTSGIHVDTSKKGLIQYTSGASKGVYQLLYHAINGYYNNNKASKIKVKELITSVKKEDLIDILLKLDMLTMHWVTGPIHMMDAISGTHIWANIQNKVTDSTKKAKEAIKALEGLKGNLDSKFKDQLQKYANGLRRIFKIENFKKVSEETVTADIAEPDIKIGDNKKPNKRKDPMNRRLKRKKIKEKD